MTRQSNRALKLLSWLPLMALAIVAGAAEEGQQRYAPGSGGSDMTTSLTPGWYGQVAMVAYHASKLKGAAGKGDTVNATKVVPASASSQTAGLAAAYAGIGYGAGLPVSYTLAGTTDVQAILPRLSYLSDKKFLGGKLGFTVMVPLVLRKGAFSASGISVPSSFQPSLSAALTPSLGPSLAAATAAASVSGVQAGVGSGVAGMGGTVLGWSDMEIAPVLHWEIGDHQIVTVAQTIVLPTGDYQVDRSLNPGYGNYFTFRPSVQYGYLGNGWDLGGRAVLSFNTRNKDNGYYSGTMFNLDYQAMAFVSDDFRLGVQGYWVRQLGRDTQNLQGFTPQQQWQLATTTDLSDGNKARVVAIGPAVAWVKNGGDFMLEGKFLKEYGARNRTEGQTFWLTFSKAL